MLLGLIKLILLPLYILKRLVWNVIWNFVYFFLKKPKRLLIILAVIGFFALMMSGSGDDNADISPEDMKVTSEYKSPLGPGPGNREPITELPPIEGKIKDGNNAFNKSLVGKMDEIELLFYSREFQYAMHYAQPGTPYLWKTKTDRMFGEIIAKKPFKAPGDIWCRRFTELLSLKNKAHRLSGLACQRLNEPGWCKLQPNSTPTCEIRRATGMGAYFDNMGDSIGRSFDYSIKKINPFD